jgi:HK97 gp10 family phage protein
MQERVERRLNTMATVSMRVDGLRELGERMRKLSADVATKAAVRATGKAARLIKKQAVLNVIRSPSVVTGSLRDAIIVKKIPKSQAQYTSEHIVTVRGKSRRGRKSKRKQAIAPHARFVELGTIKMRPEPFLRPALEMRKHEAIKVMVETLRQQIDKAGR